MKNLQQVQSQNNQLSILQVAEIQVRYYPVFYSYMGNGALKTLLGTRLIIPNFYNYRLVMCAPRLGYVLKFIPNNQVKHASSQTADLFGL